MSEDIMCSGYLLELIIEKPTVSVFAVTTVSSPVQLSSAGPFAGSYRHFTGFLLGTRGEIPWWTLACLWV
jgi:hypothetical protein